MIETLSDFPSYVTAFRCRGHVTSSDYDNVLKPTVRKALETHDKIRLYYETAPDFAIDPGAAWEDFKVGMGHVTRWERVAVVSDIHWIRRTMRAFGFLFPGRLKVFPIAEAAQAQEWITVDETET